MLQPYIESATILSETLPKEEMNYFIELSELLFCLSLNVLVSKKRFFQLQLKTAVSKLPACKHWLISGVLLHVIATTVI